jgi:hypothetical protein
LISSPYLRSHFYTSRNLHGYFSPEATALLAVLGALPAMPNAPSKTKGANNMRSRITVTITALAFGTALATAPAVAQTRQPAPSYSNTGPFSGAPLSPNGAGAGASSFGGPGAGYIGPSGIGKPAPVNYSNTGLTGAPLSPGGISAAASAYGGPGYTQTAGSSPSGTTSHGKALYAYSSSGAAPAPSYSNSRPSGAPVSPGGISAAASAFGGPGYQGN